MENNASKSKKVLIVDDMPANIKVLGEAIRSLYAISIATNGEKALMAAKEAPPPDLILLDILMPGMSGYEVCRLLKADPQTRNIPVIFITALDEIESKSKGFEAGAVDYITKPFEVEEVQARIRTHIELKQYREHLEELVDMRTRELHAALVEAEAANQAKSLFIANMSHELRTPMNGIIAATDLTLSLEPPPKIAKIQHTIRNSGYALLRIINAIIEFSKCEDGALELSEAPFRLDRLIERLKGRVLYKGREKNIALHLKLDPATTPNALMGDEEHLEEVLTHLLDNAAKFNRNPPEVMITIRPMEISDENVMLEFEVTDNGIGVDSADHDRIFEPFTQVDDSSAREYDGAGIGLAVCKRLVNLMGGDIRVESTLQAGSSFCFNARFKRQQPDQPFEWLAAKEPSTSSESPAQDDYRFKTQVDPAILTPIFHGLARGLENMNPAEIESHLASLQTYLTGAKIECIQEQISSYEYDEALTTLNEISGNIGLPLN